MSVRTRLVSVSTALLIGVGVVSVGGGAMAAPGDPGGRRFLPGAPGRGAAYFPFAGNGGYDVQHYDLDITYTPPAPDPAPLVGQLSGVATIDLVATQDLDRFTLDLRRRRGPRLLAGPRRRGPRVGADGPAPAQDQEGRDGPGRHHLWRPDHPAQGHRRRPLRLGDHARRRHVGGRTRGLEDLVPGQRPPNDQGHPPLRDHGARGEGGGRQRPTRAGPDHRGRLDHLVLGRPGSAGQLPDDPLFRLI